MPVLVTVFLAILAACTQPPLPKSPLIFPSEAATYPQFSGMKRTVLYRPSAGEGPFPAVVLMHTCGGVQPHIYDWAGRLTAAGYAVLIVDSNSPRNVSDNCLPANAAVISLDTVAGDAAAALAHLRTLSWVRSDRIAVMGFSFGAMASLRLAGAAYQERLASGANGLRAVIAFYPNCAGNLSGDVVAPTWLFLGAIDTEAPPALCTTIADQLKARGHPIDYKLYPNTTHAFDYAVFGLQGREIYHGTRGPFLYRYNPEATEDAWRVTQDFLNRRLRGD